MKFCKDCKHADGTDTYAKCRHPLIATQSTCLVTGETLTKQTYCTTQRDGIANSFNPCGIDAALFEPKENQ